MIKQLDKFNISLRFTFTNCIQLVFIATSCYPIPQATDKTSNVFARRAIRGPWLIKIFRIPSIQLLEHACEYIRSVYQHKVGIVGRQMNPRRDRSDEQHQSSRFYCLIWARLGWLTDILRYIPTLGTYRRLPSM